LIYNRLLDNDKLTVITDSTAGVDSVGTSMFCVSDINVFVVEPTKKSIDVYKDFVEITKKYKINNYVIGNKIRNQDDIEYIKSQIDEAIYEDQVGMMEMVLDIDEIASEMKDVRGE